MPEMPGDNFILGDDLKERVLRELRDEGLLTTDEAEISVEEQKSPAGNVMAAKAGEERGTEIKRCRAKRASIPEGEDRASRAVTLEGEERESFYDRDIKIHFPRSGDAQPRP